MKAEDAVKSFLATNLPMEDAIYQRLANTNIVNTSDMESMGAGRPGQLGRLLLLAAGLHEAMHSYTDQKLLDDLDPQSPIHLRRTLHQSLHWALKTGKTHDQDRDQVLYRVTSPAPGHLHRACVQPGCKQCADAVTRVPRLVMVDQLWLWILDESKVDGDLV